MEDEEEQLLEASSGSKKPSEAGGLHRALRWYFASPWVMLKDVVLFCFAVPGLVALINTSMAYGHQEPPHSHGDSSSQESTMLTGRRTTPLGTCNCGDSVRAAKAMGCYFDILAAAWLPEKCLDEELTAEFELSGDGPDGSWQYWLDLNHTQEISVDALGDHADDPDSRFYSTTQWHVTHCLFYWRKQQRARAIGGPIVEPRYDTEQHINHCSGFIREGKDGGVQAGVALASDYL